MLSSDRLSSWLTVGANVGILAGLILVAVQIEQNSELVRMQLVNDGNLASNQLWVSATGEKPLEALAKSIENPEELTFAEFLVVDLFLFSNMNLLYRNYELAREGIFDENEWQASVEALAPYFIANKFGRIWWREEASAFFSPEFSAFVNKQLEEEGAMDTQAYWLRIKKRLKEE
ncbi:MAG: hypothetical protein KUG71_03895 [Porticoccaceae bacterium]|nr:hypothetical protein [Porticoccaceae bacterium]